MTGLMKITFVVLGLVALTPPAAAQSHPAVQSTQPVQSTQSVPASAPPATRFQQLNPALNTKIPNTVHEGGHKYLGRDPDATVRSQIMRDETMHKGNNY